MGISPGDPRADDKSGDRVELNADLISYTAAVVFPLVVGATLATVLIQQLFSLLQLPFDLAWWTLLLGVNIAATALSQAVGRLVPRAGPSGPTFYPLSSFALAIGTLSSLALHLTNVVIKIMAGVAAAQDASVAGYLTFAVFDASADGAYLLLLSSVTAIAWASGLGTAHALRDGSHAGKPALTYFVAVLLFVINTLFLQTWTAVPAEGVHNASVFTAIALALTCALTLASLLYLFGTRLWVFVASVRFAASKERAGAPWAILSELSAGIAVGVLWASLGLLSLSAFAFLTMVLAAGLEEALAFLVAMLAPLREWLLATWPYAVSFIAAGVFLALSLPSARGPEALAPPAAPAFRQWRLNAPPLWVFAASLAAIGALVLVIANGTLALGFIARLLSYLRGLDEAAAAFVLFVLFAQVVALAGLIVFGLGRASVALAGRIDVGRLWRALRGLWGSAASIATLFIGALALALGAGLVLALLFAIARALWPFLIAATGTLTLVVLIGLLVVLLVAAAPVFVERMRVLWLWLKPIAERLALPAVALLMLLSATIALSPFYPTLAALPGEISPVMAEWWGSAFSSLPGLLRRLVESAVLVLVCALGLVGGLWFFCIAALAVWGLLGRGGRFMASRPRLAVGAAAALVLLVTAPYFLEHFPPNEALEIVAQKEPAAPPEQLPSIEALQALIFRDTDFWRFDSINEVSDGAAGYAPVIDRVVTDASLCQHDALLVASAASSDGPTAYNQTLAQCRALVVSEVLRERLAAQCGGDAAGRVWIMNMGPSRRTFASRADRLVGIVAVGGARESVDADYLESLISERGSEVEAAIGRSLGEYERGRPERGDGDVEGCRRWFSR